jgi:hypothetical protein
MTTKITIKEQYIFIHEDEIIAKKSFETDEDALEHAQEIAQKRGVNNMQALRHIGYGHTELAH